MGYERDESATVVATVVAKLEHECPHREVAAA
jgi:hypothetical protein